METIKFPTPEVREEQEKKELKFPTPEEIKEVMKGEKFCDKLGGVISIISSKGKEPGFVASQSLDNLELCFSEVEEGSDHNAPDLYTPFGHIKILDLHGHPTVKELGFVSPTPIDVSDDEPDLGDRTQEAIDYLKGRNSNMSSAEFREEMRRGRKEFHEKFGQVLEDNKETLKRWTVYDAVVGITNGTVDVLIYQAPLPGKEREREEMKKRLSKGGLRYGDKGEIIKGNFETQEDVLNALKIACPFVALLKYKKEGEHYRMIE
ncbi:hypothetical protein HQ544_03945 [Candidatus Falkowbacteria bacterium]|nr:hypothetical protein [Candidatus Falkowbacteria bacterium]